MSMTFFLLAWQAYGCCARKPSLGRHFSVFFSFALSLLSKPQSVTFPFLLFAQGTTGLWDGSAPRGLRMKAQDSDPPKYSWGWLLLEKLPLLLDSRGRLSSGAPLRNLRECQVAIGRA